MRTCNPRAAAATARMGVYLESVFQIRKCSPGAGLNRENDAQKGKAGSINMVSPQQSHLWQISIGFSFTCFVRDFGYKVPDAFGFKGQELYSIIELFEINNLYDTTMYFPDFDDDTLSNDECDKMIAKIELDFQENIKRLIAALELPDTSEDEDVFDELIRRLMFQPRTIYTALLNHKRRITEKEREAYAPWMGRKTIPSEEQVRSHIINRWHQSWLYKLSRKGVEFRLSTQDVSASNTINDKEFNFRTKIYEDFVDIELDLRGYVEIWNHIIRIELTWQWEFYEDGQEVGGDYTNALFSSVDIPNIFSKYNYIETGDTQDDVIKMHRILKRVGKPFTSKEVLSALTDLEKAWRECDAYFKKFC